MLLCFFFAKILQLFAVKKIYQKMINLPEEGFLQRHKGHEDCFP
jgi:hypothetical protein